MNLVGQLPAEISGQHFGPQLRSFVLYQYYHAHVTQPLLLEQLREWKIDISAGQLSTLITQGHDGFYLEKDLLLRVGLQRCRAAAMPMSTIRKHAIKAGMVIVRILSTNALPGLPLPTASVEPTSSLYCALGMMPTLSMRRRWST